MLSTIVVIASLMQLQVMVCGLSTRSHKAILEKVAGATNSPTTNVLERTKANGNYLDCNECFGHGQKKNADPRCRYGCGRVMTFPPTPDRDEYMNEFLESATDASTTMPTIAEFFSLFDQTVRVTHKPASKKSNFLSQFTSWRGILGIGILFIICIIIAMSVVYKKKLKPLKKRVSFSWTKSTDTIATEA